MSYFLGIDVGGTKTHALIADQAGYVKGFGVSGPGNHEVVGYDGLAEALSQATRQAMHAAQIEADQIVGAGFGIAGFDFPSERAETLAAIGALGLSCPLGVVNDVVVGLIAGASQGWGIVVDAGTGCNVRGRDQYGREGWVTGCGAPFGEYGGAGDIVARAVQAIAHHWSQRGPVTALSAAFMQMAGAKDLTGLIEGLALGTIQIGGEYAREVFRVAAAGDRVACEVISWVATELGETANAVIRQLGIQTLPFEVVLIGSVFKGGNLFSGPLQRAIQAFAPQATFTRLHVPPVAGGVLLGMEQVGPVQPEMREHLLKTTGSFLSAGENQ